MNPVILADNRFADGTPTATDTAPGYDVLNIRDLASYTSWKAASAGLKSIMVDCGSAKSADSVALFKHNLGTAGAWFNVASREAFDLFNDSSFDSVLWGYSSEGSGSIVETTLLTIGTAGANDAALVYSKRQYNKTVMTVRSMKFQYVVGYGAECIIGVQHRADAPGSDTAVNQVGRAAVEIDAISGGIRFFYRDAAGVMRVWKGSTQEWTTDPYDLWFAGAPNTTYRVDLASDGLNVSAQLYDANGINLASVPGVPWANIWSTADPAWVCFGDLWNDGNYGTLRVYEYDESLLLVGDSPTNDRAIFLSFGSVSKRYWRLRLYSAAPIQIGEAMIGMRITFPYPPNTPFRPVSEKVVAESARSKTGQLLGTVVRHVGYEIRPTWKKLSRSWVDANLVPFWKNWASAMKPFFWAWDLDAYPDDVRFVKIPDDFTWEPSVSVGPSYDEVPLCFEGVRE